MNNRDYFQILGVNEDASFEEIKRNYHEKIRKYHPDKALDYDKQEFMKIQEAWEALKTEEGVMKYRSKLQSNTETCKVYYNELDLDDMEYIEEEDRYIYECRCGDTLSVTTDQLEQGIEIIHCNGCSLSLSLVYEVIHESSE